MDEANGKDAAADTEVASIRERLGELDTKAYYLLVALSFIYSRQNESYFSLKVALGLTAISAVLPVQDFIKSKGILRTIQGGKIACLIIALASILYWVFFVAGAQK